MAPVSVENLRTGKKEIIENDIIKPKNIYIGGRNSMGVYSFKDGGGANIHIRGTNLVVVKASDGTKMNVGDSAIFLERGQEIIVNKYKLKGVKGSKKK